MNIAQAKQHVKDTIEAYLATDAAGRPLIETARQRPIFLVGAPGIGKTAIMSQIASELEIGFVSYSMTHHTRQSALGLPFIVHRSYGNFDYDASEYTMSEIIASVYEYMGSTAIEHGILFLDEINCVSETLYPSMLQFLQFKAFGRHRVPEGWIIVTAGNPPEYNKAVHEFDIVTLDRVKKIAVEPDYEAWKTYALARRSHPAILTFLSVKKDHFYSIETTFDGKSFVTARGWDDLSDMITIYEHLEKTVDYDLVVQYVQNARIAGEFSLYYELFNKYRSDYRIEEILAGGAIQDVVERARSAEFDERLSLVGLLLDAICESMREVLERAEVLVELRDALKDIRITVENEGADALGCLERLQEERRVRLEALLAVGAITKAKRDLIERTSQTIVELTNDLRLTRGIDPAADLAWTEDWFNGQVATLQPQVDALETKLVNAFDFLLIAFGDKQEVLIFATELTTRAVAVQYIGQFGSDSYFAHNSDLMLSERQRDLRRRIDELDR